MRDEPRIESRRWNRRCHGLRGHRKLDLGSIAGGAPHGRVSAEALHPADDRIADATPVGRNRRRVKANAAIAHARSPRCTAPLDRIRPTTPYPHAPLASRR